MMTILLECCHCSSENIMLHGRITSGKQCYNCHKSGRSSRKDPQPKGYTEVEHETILRAYGERSSLRGLERTFTFGVSRNTLSAWFKENRWITTIKPNVNKARAKRPHPSPCALELAELWSPRSQTSAGY